MRRPLFALFAAAAVSAAAALPVSAAPSEIPIRIYTSAGTIDVTLDAVHTPNTTKNFLKYVDAKFYNGGTFFRAIPGFVIQGGNKAKESPADKPIDLEWPAKTGVKNVDGAIAMARTSDLNSATSEFFIDDGAQARLDGTDQVPGYTAFGHVTKGMDVVRKIVNMPKDGDQLLQPVKILRIVRVK
jgi:peptidyl-prolyl cis-trans isomerase A (cyclophilin A)